MIGHPERVPARRDESKDLHFGPSIYATNLWDTSLGLRPIEEEPSRAPSIRGFSGEWWETSKVKSTNSCGQRTRVVSPNFVQLLICHPERSLTRFLRQTEPKDLRLLLLITAKRYECL
jgi:hypothetical protein